MWMPSFDATGMPTFVNPMQMVPMAWNQGQEEEQLAEKLPAGDKTADRDVRRLGSFFGIDQQTLERLDEFLERRKDSRERDLAKLYEILETARNPSRLLMAKLDEMEDGQFVTNFKRDENIDRLCEQYKLNEAARCRLVELRVRRKSTQEEDHARLQGHLQLCSDPSYTAVSLVKKVTQGRSLGWQGAGPGRSVCWATATTSSSPRPKTTRRLCGWLVSTASKSVPLEEVAILGNCKRFDIYVALAQPVEATEVGRHVAEAICQQMAWHHEMAGWSPALWLRRAAAGFDMPESVAVEPLAMADAQVKQESWQLQRSLELRSGDAVSTYACSVAMALEGRTRSAFNPCSAREAHIMLQLKRSLEAATGGDNAPCGRRLLCIWRMALEAGKALRAAAEPLARGPAQYTEAERLLATQLVKCKEKLRGFRQGGAVAQLRASAMELLESEEWEDPSRARRRVQRLLHEPSVALKAGMDVNETKILQEVKSQLQDLSTEAQVEPGKDPEPSETTGASQKNGAQQKTSAELGAINGLNAELVSLLRGEEPKKKGEDSTEDESSPAAAQGPQTLKGMSAEQRAMLFID